MDEKVSVLIEIVGSLAGSGLVSLDSVLGSPGTMCKLSTLASVAAGSVSLFSRNWWGLP